MRQMKQVGSMENINLEKTAVVTNKLIFIMSLTCKMKGID